MGHWPPRKLGRFWLYGLSIEAAFIAIPALWGPVQSKEPLSDGQRELRSFWARMDSIERGLLPPPRELTDAERAALRQLIRDSLGFEFVRRGDTTHVVAVTDEARATEEYFTRGLRQLGRGLAIMALVLALIYLPIPIGLVFITGLWLWQRRGQSISFGAADV